MRLVHIRTADFEADALHIGEMPADQVLRIATQDNPAKQALLTYQLFKRAVVTEEDRAKFTALSFDQVVHVLNTYATASPIDVPITHQLEENL